METLADIKQHTALTNKLRGQYLKTKWQIVPGKSEKSGKYLIEILEAAFRFDNCNVVSIWKGREALADYERKCEANRKLISENLPQPQQEFEDTVSGPRGREMPKSVMEDAESAERRVHDYLPYSPRTRSESCLLSFNFDLDRVHKLIAVAKAKFRRGETANKCTVNYWDFLTSGYQPLLKLEFTKVSSNPSIDLKEWEPKLGPRL